MPSYSSADLRPLVEAQDELFNSFLSFLVDVDSQHSGSTRVEAAASVRKVLSYMTVGAAQSTSNLVKSTSEVDLHVRDWYGTARSVVETLVNATFILGEGEAMADRAIAHANQKSYRSLNRTFGKGHSRLRLRVVDFETIHVSDDLRADLKEFTSSRGREKNWTDLSVEERIAAIGAAFNEEIASGFLSAYAIVYQQASEILHGSLYGILSFLQRSRQSLLTEEGRQELAEEHLADILAALFLARYSQLQAMAIASS